MEVLKDGFLKHGGTMVAEESYRAGDTNFNAQLNVIRQKNPDSIFLPSYYPEAALIIRQARQLGIDVPFLGTDGWDSAEFLKRLRAIRKQLLLHFAFLDRKCFRKREDFQRRLSRKVSVRAASSARR